MAHVIGVRFRRTGKIYSFQTPDEVAVGEAVVVETERGPELGTVVIPPHDLENDQPLRPVLRKATPEDRESVAQRCQQAREAVEKGRGEVASRELPMKLLAAEYSLDGSRLTFYFSAAGRVDFRELVRALASTFHARIEMRQVGPRDESKLLGGIGQCGQLLCCHRWLTEFTPVSIRMAKEQELALNPLKISGLCGRLLCCLSYEVEQYIQARQKLPRRGQKVLTPMGPAVVVGGNAIKETVLAQLESEAVVEVPLAEVQPQS